MFKIIPLSLVIIYSSTLYADINQAKELFDKSDCTQCHSVEKFKYRKDKISNFDKLHKTVNSCALNSAAGWFDEEVKDVSLYLNHNYYHFKVKK